MVRAVLFPTLWHVARLHRPPDVILAVGHCITPLGFSVVLGGNRSSYHRAGAPLPDSVVTGTPELGVYTISDTFIIALLYNTVNKVLFEGLHTLEGGWVMASIW